MIEGMNAWLVWDALTYIMRKEAMKIPETSLRLVMVDCNVGWFLMLLFGIHNTHLVQDGWMNECEFDRLILFIVGWLVVSINMMGLVRWDRLVLAEKISSSSVTNK